MDLLYLAYCLSLFLTPIVLYLLLLQPKKSTIYTQPDWYHFVKEICAKPYVRKFQRRWAKELEFIPDELQEKPGLDLGEDEIDSQVIYGADAKGNYFCLKISLKYTLHAEVFIEYRNNEGKIYKLPNESQVLICSIASRQWKAAGLHIEILQPFQRLRITYNGLMRCHSRNVQEDVEYVKFHFIWNSASEPLRYPQDVDVDLLTEAVARERWRNGDWINMLGDDRGYDQFGALNGFFNAKSLREDNFVYMPSWRRRRIGPGETGDLKRDFFIFGILDDGMAFSVGAKSRRTGCTQIKYGCVFTSTGDLHSISSNDIQLENLADNLEVPGAFSVHFRANGRDYKCVCHVNVRKTSVTCNRERNGWITKITTAECDVNSEQAKAILTFWYRNQGDGMDLPIPLLTAQEADDPEDVFITNLTKRECLDHTLTGGKGNSLGMLAYSLKTDKFEVPIAFVISSIAFSYQLNTNPQLTEAIADLEDICYDRQPGEVGIACKRTADIFAKTPISPKIRDLITDEISRLKSQSKEETWRWAVRSSGLDEDSEELSAAGQNTTLLGCISDDDVLRAVANCWGSLFSYQSVEYRRRHGIPVNTQMAVVVQKTIPADSAGVLFTCHPSTGDPSQMMITSNYGLGESVVSGSSDPDTIILSRTYTDKLAVLKVEIGEKKIKVTIDDHQTGTKEDRIDVNLAGKLSITEEQALKLGEIGILLEKRFGGPRDIEWAFADGKLYLLQSRPITTLNNWSDWELQHEFDTPIFSEESLYTRANIGEVVKGALTVLSQSVVIKVLDFETRTKAFDRKANMYAMGPIIISSHTGFMDVLNYMYSAVKDKLDLETHAVDLAIFGHIVLNEELLEISLKRHGPMKGVKALKHFITLGKKTWNNSKVLQAVLRHNNYWQIKLAPSYSPLMMLEKIEEQFDQLTTLFAHHIHTSTTSIIYQMAAMLTMTENSKEFKDEHYTDVALLLSTNSAVESAEIPVILEGITTRIRQANLADEFVKVKPQDGMEWLKENCLNVRKSLDEFLETHGHRVLKEVELKEKTWSMDPSVVIAMLQANCISETTTKKAKGYTVEETIAKLNSPKKALTKFILKFLVSKCRQAVAGREKSKSEMIRGINRFRLAYIEVGRAMVSHGLLPEDDLVFHLTHEELKSVARGKSPGLVARASKRKRQYEKWDKLHFPELNYGIPVPEDDQIELDRFNAVSGGIRLKGTPVYEGNIIARACVITDIKDAKTIQPGDILITNSTDIAWSPYFPMLSGVVTELGGLISHGAVVAREYGLPCVVGVKNATRYFKTGDKIRLLGKLGQLELVE